MQADRTPTQTILALYEAYGSKDTESLRTLLSPEVSWEQCEGFPGGGQRRGPDEVIAKVLQGNADRWRGFSVSVDEMIESGGTVVVLGAYEGVHAETDRSMRAVFAHVYRVEGQRIVRFQQIADTWPMVAAMQSSSESGTS